MAPSVNVSMGPRNAPPPGVRREQTREYHDTDETAFQRMLALKPKNIGGSRTYAAGPVPPHNDFAPMHPQNHLSTISHQSWDTHTAPSLAQNGNFTQQQTALGASPSRLEPTTPAFVPRAPGLMQDVPVPPGHLQNVQTTGLSNQPAANAGLSQARRASDEQRATGGSKAVQTAPVPAVAEDPEAFSELVEQAMARILSQNESISEEQADDDEDDTASEKTIRASTPPQKSTREQELEAQIQELKEENDRLEEENLWWIQQYQVHQDQLSKAESNSYVAKVAISLLRTRCKSLKASMGQERPTFWS